MPARDGGHITSPGSETAQLQLEGHELIAWVWTEYGTLAGLWRPLPGPGPRWYKFGCRSRISGGLDVHRMSKRDVIWHWNRRGPSTNFSSRWHRLCSTAEAFPERRKAAAELAAKPERPLQVPWPKGITGHPTATADDLPDLFGPEATA